MFSYLTITASYRFYQNLVKYLKNPVQFVTSKSVIFKNQFGFRKNTPLVMPSIIQLIKLYSINKIIERNNIQEKQHLRHLIPLTIINLFPNLNIMGSKVHA